MQTRAGNGLVAAVGERIRNARIERGLTQAQLAKRLGVTSGAVGQWEIGRDLPRAERLADLAAALKLSVDVLLGIRPPVAALPDAPPPEELVLLAEARQLGVDLRRVVADARRRRWAEENRQALADANAFLDRHGLWSDGRRLF